MNKVILASKSPRRKELLGSLNLTFDSIESHIDESRFEIEVPEELVKELSRAKALAVAEGVNEPSIVIGSDTVVVFNNEIIGKPTNEDHAYQLLSMLSGKQHVVYTGLAIVDTENKLEYVTYEKTNVYMRNFSEDEIKSYIKTNEPMDKAGAYGIQGIGAVLVERIEGDFYSVMGFPIVKFYEGMKQLGYSLL